jgi:hypothetical protein
MQIDVVLRDRKIFYDYDIELNKIKHLTTVFYKDIKNKKCIGG